MQQTHNAPLIEITPIPAFQDNYIWMLHQPGPEQTWVVDPGDAAPVEATLAALGRSLDGILITHHHPDHTGGLEALLAARDIPVYGPQNPSIQRLTDHFGHGDRFSLMGHEVEVLATPGHTLDHICFLLRQHPPPLLFCGDTLFAAGCGRLFEGTPAQMHASLTLLAGLPPETLLHCAHEYTLANLAFAGAVEPDNADIQARTARCREHRDRGQPTLPCSIGEELATNPFLRSDAHSVRRAAIDRGLPASASATDVFASVRAWKDCF